MRLLAVPRLLLVASLVGSIVASLSACSGPSPEAPRAAAPAANANATTDEPAPSPTRLQDAADLRDGVGTFTSIPWGFDTNSFWIEGPESVIVLDTQFLPSEAEHLIEVIEARTKKKVTTAIVLHPNPDKFNGADVFRAHGAKVVTSSAVQRQIPAVAEKRRKAFQARYAPDYPERDPAFDKTFEHSMKLQDGGVELELHVLGRGCSEAHVVVTWNGHVFPGDLVANGTHAWLELGYVREWLQRIDDMEGMKPRRVHPGRGASGGPELLAAQRKYLERVRDLVDAARPTMPAPPGAVDAIKAQVVAEYPALDYDVFLRGLGAVWRNEAAHLSSKP